MHFLTAGRRMITGDCCHHRFGIHHSQIPLLSKPHCPVDSDLRQTVRSIAVNSEMRVMDGSESDVRKRRVAASFNSRLQRTSARHHLWNHLASSSNGGPKLLNRRDVRCLGSTHEAD